TREPAVQSPGEPACAERNDGGAAVGEAARPRPWVGLPPFFPRGRRKSVLWETTGQHRTQARSRNATPGLFIGGNHVGKLERPLR
ncbi:MAG: hypothetical protein OXU36_17795, partial [Candidatus Poribacteria bacterium]|nr:hypothetical protein [Candidatus Poribacteria bacterium]